MTDAPQPATFDAASQLGVPSRVVRREQARFVARRLSVRADPWYGLRQPAALQG